MSLEFNKFSNQCPQIDLYLWEGKSSSKTVILVSLNKENSFILIITVYLILLIKLLIMMEFIDMIQKVDFFHSIEKSIRHSSRSTIRFKQASIKIAY